MFLFTFLYFYSDMYMLFDIAEDLHLITAFKITTFSFGFNRSSYTTFNVMGNMTQLKYNLLEGLNIDNENNISRHLLAI